MATVAQRWDGWLDLVSDLAARPCARFPQDEVGRQLAESFQTRVSWNWGEGERYGVEMHDPIPGWPTEEDVERWAREGIHLHPILCYYQRTGDTRPMSVGRVPRDLAPREGFAMLRENLTWIGMDQQLSIPYGHVMTPTSYRTILLAQTGEDYSDEDVELARLVQPLVALLERQVTLLAGVDVASAAPLALTGRELVVLRLLAEGRTAVSIAHVLQVSPRTVHAHLAHVYRKLGVCDRMRAVLVAQRAGILTP